ncbi:MAG: phosphate acyltransferase PlsX [Bacteroidetes bacterium]|nr:phosphate acyltransferase PlsX [Bacteroidota bacterium]
MKIGIDIMGGDYAPNEVVLGVIQSLPELEGDTRLVLFGDEVAIKDLFSRENADISLVDIVHTTEVIGMDEQATRAIAGKPDSSISRGFEHLKAGKIDGFASAGNSGAMMVGAMFSVKTVPGILRPAISSVIPKEDGSWGLFLDAGANADCKPEHLQQFAILGSLFLEHVYGVPNPKVGLMNIGEEEEKGNMLCQATHPLLKNTREINFIGNIEGRDLFNDKADVIVCDGFTGNVILKLAESFYSLIRRRKIKDEYFDRFNFENYGGTPVLGVNAPVIIAHGISNARAIKNMIHITRKVTAAGLTEKIAQAVHESITQ